MDPWFANLSAQKHLSCTEVLSLQHDGFIVMQGAVPPRRLVEASDVYDHAVSAATLDDVKVGSTTTRVSDFVNRGAAFDQFYISPPVLEAACRIIQQPFKLSTMHARTLRPGVPGQRLHVDFASDCRGWPMLGFIYMIDEFTEDNGATRFIAGSQGIETLPESFSSVPACGPAGSVIVFNGSVWHGHGPNETDQPRRSIQGAYIRRNEDSSATLSVQMLPQTLDRIDALAKYLLNVNSSRRES
jgi:ectoine hydroxylase-related dioxygenase (phytanoyl-CoA dioxygenase family)